MDKFKYYGDIHEWWKIEQEGSCMGWKNVILRTFDRSLMTTCAKRCKNYAKISMRRTVFNIVRGLSIV